MSDRAVVFSPNAQLTRWIEEELSGDAIEIDWHTSMSTIAAALTSPMAFLDVLVVDFESVSTAEERRLEGIRDSGWRGRIVALGDVPPELRVRLQIECVLSRPFGSERLRTAVLSPSRLRRTAPISSLK